MRRLGIEDAARIAVGVGKGYLVRFHLDAGSVACRNAYVAAGILYIDDAVGWNGRVQDLLIEIVLGAAEHVEEVVVIAPT